MAPRKRGFFLTQKINKPPLENPPPGGMNRAGGLFQLYPWLSESQDLIPSEAIPPENHNPADCLRLLAQRMMVQRRALICDED